MEPIKEEVLEEGDFDYHPDNLEPPELPNALPVLDDGPPPPAPQQNSEPVRVGRVVPVLVLARRELLMPQQGEPAFLSLEVPRNEKGLKKLRRVAAGRLDGRNHNAGHIGHCLAYYYLSPQGNDWRSIECLREVGPDWVVQRSHVVGALNALATPACRCGFNPHKVSRINQCSSCLYIYTRLIVGR